MAGVAQYHWNCSVPDDDGERYIPGIERDFEDHNNIEIISTAGDSLITIYRIRNLNADCTSEAVTAIEFCYQYNTEGPGEAVFNWTVLILEEGDEFAVTKIITIISNPDELEGHYCTNSEGVQIACCDREDTSNFNIQTNNFAFGVTESAQGNTRGATLLGFHDTEAEYSVDTLELSVAGQNVSVGSTLRRPQGVQRGLRLLWFITGIV